MAEKNGFGSPSLIGLFASRLARAIPVTDFQVGKSKEFANDIKDLLVQIETAINVSDCTEEQISNLKTIKVVCEAIIDEGKVWERAKEVFSNFCNHDFELVEPPCLRNCAKLDWMDEKHSHFSCTKCGDRRLP